MDLRLISVNVAMPRIIARLDTGPVESGISKIRVAAPSVFVGSLNIAGDGQADLIAHGGPDKAVYAYPSDHWLWWAERGFETVSGTFGENLTTLGATEDEVRIGDRFGWGEAVLEVSQPRSPCYKFAIHTNRADAPQLMTVSARTGWYHRVVQEGVAPVAGGALVRISTIPENPSVQQAFRAISIPQCRSISVSGCVMHPVFPPHGASLWSGACLAKSGKFTPVTIFHAIIRNPENLVETCCTYA